jgi:hypothetical protein
MNKGNCNMPPSAEPGKAGPGCWRLAGLAGVGIVVAGLAYVVIDPATGNLQDFVEYWGADRLNAQGQNPYDAAALYQVEREVSPGLTEAIMMWNPPWTLALAMPFGLMPPHAGHALWLLLQLGVTWFCAGQLWTLYGGPARYRWLAWLISLAFIPTLFLLRMGQISSLPLLGIVGFLVLQKCGRDACAGAVLVLAAIKPHLVLLFGVALLLWVVERRRWTILAGGGAAVLALMIGPLACNPQVLHQYWEAMAHQPPQMLSPTFGSLLRLVLGFEHFRLQFAPAVIGIAWMVVHWCRRRRTWDWAAETPVLLLASFLIAPYGAWPFDLVILIVPVIQLAVALYEKGRANAIGFALVALAGFDAMALAMMNVRYTDLYWYVWMTPMLSYCYWSLGRQLKQASVSRAPAQVREPVLLEHVSAVTSGR